jgi:hypothetical protein
VKTIIMEHFNGILFHKSGPANKQHTNQSKNSIPLPKSAISVYLITDLITLRSEGEIKALS